MEGFPRIRPAGDLAVLVEFGTEIDPALNRQVHAVVAPCPKTENFSLHREPALDSGFYRNGGQFNFPPSQQIRKILSGWSPRGTRRLLL